MKLDEIKSIIRSTTRGDWIIRDGTLILKDDVDLRIVEGEPESAVFAESWASAPLSGDPHRVEIAVWYRESKVIEISMVSLDGGRAIVPMPDQNMKLDADEFALARLLDSAGMLPRYLGKHGLIVDAELTPAEQFQRAVFTPLKGQDHDA